METIAAINDEAETPWAHADTGALAAADEAYTLTPDAISHLDDVYALVSTLFYVIVGAAVIAAFCFMVMLRMWGVRSVSGVLLGAGIAVCALFAVCGVGAAVNFNGFFRLFHSLFFSSGSWLFSADSLLICMYPQAFWVGMGAIWLAVTLVLSVLCILGGALLRRKPITEECQQAANAAYAEALAQEAAEAAAAEQAEREAAEAAAQLAAAQPSVEAAESAEPRHTPPPRGIMQKLNDAFAKKDDEEETELPEDYYDESWLEDDEDEGWLGGYAGSDEADKKQGDADAADSAER